MFTSTVVYFLAIGVVVLLFAVIFLKSTKLSGRIFEFLGILSIVVACVILANNYLTKDVTATATTQENQPAVGEAKANSPQKDPVVSDQVWLGNGKYIDWEGDKISFLQSDGNYSIPVSYLKGKVGSGVGVFEGEFFDTVGFHHICTLFLEGSESECPVADGVFKINQGSFWSYDRDGKSAVEDVLMTFGHDKWQNWKQQEIVGNPIIVHLPTGLVKFSAGREPVLSDDQMAIVKWNAEVRCPEDTPILEVPYSDATSISDTDTVIGAPGSYSCRTLFVGQENSGSDTVAIVWLGAKDGFQYLAKDARFFLLPNSWDETEIADFVKVLIGKDVEVQFQ